MLLVLVLVLVLVLPVLLAGVAGLDACAASYLCVCMECTGSKMKFSLAPTASGATTIGI